MCNAANHLPWCQCGFGGDTGGGFRLPLPLPQRIVWQDRETDFSRQTTCPECGSKVYFVRHNGGSVWFDELRPPWPKHGCFDDDGVGRLLRRNLTRTSNASLPALFGIVTETLALRSARRGRVVVRCSDGSTIDREFESELELSSFVGQVMMIRRTDTGTIELSRVVARSSSEPIVRVLVKSPGDCSTSEVAAFERLVIMGSEVETRGLTNRIERANKLGFAYVSRVLAGVAGVKRPSSKHRTDVFAKAATEFASMAFELEFGWVYILEPHRGKGIAGKLTRVLLKPFENLPIYATSRSDNTAMHRTLERMQFSRTGNEFLSGRRNHRLQLFVRGS